jgi:hypothetical protein
MSDLKNVDAVIIELHDNPLTERTDDRYGRIVNIASVDTDTLIARALSSGFNGNAASMKATLSAVEAEAIKAVARGEIVNYGLGHVSVDVEGAFIGDAPSWDPAIHHLVARVTPSKPLRQALKSTPVRIRGMAPDSSVISKVTDVATGKVNALLTPGGMANLQGTRIKIVGDAENTGLWLTNQDTQEKIKVPITAIGINDPKWISFVVPLSIPSGSYMLSIATQFAGGGKNLKEPRTIVLNAVLAVDYTS